MSVRYLLQQPQQPQPQLQPPQQQQQQPPPPPQQQAPVATNTSAPGGPGSGGTVGVGVGSSAGVKTWSSVTSSQEGGGPERNFLGHQSPFFPQEFPKLAGGDVPIDGTQRSATDSQYGPGPSLRPQSKCHIFQVGACRVSLFPASLGLERSVCCSGRDLESGHPAAAAATAAAAGSGGRQWRGWWRAGLWPTRRPASEQWQWRERTSIVCTSAKGSPPLRCAARWWTSFVTSTALL